jgi:ABC-type multidrug transport system fused ATPase/permease subunit
LLFSIYGPETGRITIDGQDISGLEFDSFRQTISMVPQYGVLFNDSILFNLKYSNPDASMEEIIEVCKACEIHDKIVSVAEGYDTQVGELGGKLSGGER